MVDLIMDAEMTFGEEDDEIEIQDLTWEMVFSLVLLFFCLFYNYINQVCIVNREKAIINVVIL